MSEQHVPLSFGIPAASALMGCSLERAYRMAADGSLPILPGGGRLRVLTAKFEIMIGRRLTAEDIAAAEKKMEPIRARRSEAARRCRARKAAKQIQETVAA